MTPLDKPLKRSLKIKGSDFVVTLTPQALKVTQKGHRRGLEMLWESLISGESALAVALQASVGRFESQATSNRVVGPISKKPRTKQAKKRKISSR